MVNSVRHPLHHDLRAWKRILLRTYGTMTRENLGLIAAGMAFWCLLGLVPAVGAVASLYGLVANPSDIIAHLDLLEDVVPAEAFDLMRERIDAADDQAGQPVGVGFLVTTLLAIWTAKTAVMSGIAGLNLAYREHEGRGLVMFYVVPYTLTFVLMLVVVVAILALVITPTIVAFAPLGPYAEWTASILRWPIAFAAALFGLGAFYRYGPNRRKARLPWVTVGAVFAGLLWAGVSALFTWYVREYSVYGEGYGALGAVLGLLMFFWLSAYAGLIGGALNAEIEFETEADTTVGRERPRGQRGAWVADNVPEGPEPRGGATRSPAE